jgi:hypothetical protein
MLMKANDCIFNEMQSFIKLDDSIQNHLKKRNYSFKISKTANLENNF